MSPSEYYKQKRPEYFSDSKSIYEVVLTREQLAFELSQISKNQKQDEFETFSRRLAEKFIAPNLIPQVGPTGGGDAKVDSETYPVSQDISERWFIPENGWSNGEKWGFAISAKEDWKSKLKADVSKIINTNRGYTRVYFITNQKPSAKDKSNAQDKLKAELEIEVVILDGEWILEKVFANDLINLVVDSLNLSEIFKRKIQSVGRNDAERLEKLSELESKINNPNRYSEFDFQLVEDCIEAAILSRMLEKPRDEVDGKFERAIRFCKKTDNHKQWVRIHYQRAWTNLNWYDDYPAFITEFNNFKKRVSVAPATAYLELYVNLFNVLIGLSNSGKCDLGSLGVSMADEEKKIFSLLNLFENNPHKLCSSLIAKTYKTILFLMSSLGKEAAGNHIKDLSNHINNSRGFIEFPFEHFKNIIEVFGDVFPDSLEFDILTDTIGDISESRHSELAAGETFLKRGIQKMEADLYKDGIVYFGKAVLKLAKEESKDGMYISLIGLSRAYKALGLVWAASNCLVGAGNISLNSWREKGLIDERTYSCAKELAINELLLGRIPPFLAFHELTHVLAERLNPEDAKEDFNMIDAFLSVRILNTDSKFDEALSGLPDVLKQHALWLSEDCSYYKLGYIELIERLFPKLDIKSKDEVDKHFQLIYDQPFKHQMLHETNFIDNENIIFSSVILGCKFNIYFRIDKELYLTAEILLAYFEAFFATSLDSLFPSSETIEIYLERYFDAKAFEFAPRGMASNEYEMRINKFDFALDNRDEFWNSIWGMTSHLMSRNLFSSDARNHVEALFKSEEVIERLTLIFEYRKFIKNLLGNKSSSRLQDWYNSDTMAKYPNKRLSPVSFKKEESIVSKDRLPKNLEGIGHNARKVLSVIDINLWDQAKWCGFGFFVDRRGLGIFFAYENIEAGKQIFDSWLAKFGHQDNDEKIRITVVKGTHSGNPHWYKVHVSSNINSDLFESTQFILSPSRFREINAESPNNLNNLIQGFSHFKEYRLCPVTLLPDGQIKPYMEKAILKKELFVRNAWEIGLNDLDSVVIVNGDKPIIPNDVANAPVLELLRDRKSDKT